MDLVEFLNARYSEAHYALLSHRYGHPGPCLNVEGQRPEDYDDRDSCFLHLRLAEATPYRDVGFGLAEVITKRRLLDVHHHDVLPDGVIVDECVTCSGVNAAWPCPTLRLLALPYADHPAYDEAWRP